MQIVDDIIMLLLSYPDLKAEFDENDILHIHSNKTSTVLNVTFGKREHTMCFDGCHWHFDNDDIGNTELIEVIAKIITNNAYIRITKKDGIICGWELDINYLPNTPYQAPVRTKRISLLSLNPFKRKEVEYRQLEFL